MDIIKLAKLALYICIAFALAGCCCNPQPPGCMPTSDATVKLAEAAASISQSLITLDAIEKASACPVGCKTLPYPTSFDMQQTATIDWSGPIEPLLKRIACICNYTLRVIGARPAIPILVTLYAKNTPIGYLIRDADFQAGCRATVQVYPGIHVIELRYARS